MRKKKKGKCAGEERVFLDGNGYVGGWIWEVLSFGLERAWGRIGR